jgi:hypothetical protein
LQTELAIDTNLVVTGTHVAVADAQKAIAGTLTVVVDTHTMVADIHQSVLTGRVGTCHKNHSVGTTWRPSTQSAYHPLDWRVASPGPEGLFRARGADREGCWTRRKPGTHRSHRCRGDWENVYRPHRPPPQSGQRTVWREPTIHSL